MADAGRVTGGMPTRNGKTARTEQLSACFNKSQRERERERGRTPNMSAAFSDCSVELKQVIEKVGWVIWCKIFSDR